MSRLAPVQQKRYPLADVNDGRRTNLHQQPPSPPPPQKQEPVADKAKRPSSPPLPRQNAKVTPPSPPKIIIDQQRNSQYARIGLLGEGGFARVYEVKDLRGARQACKVVTKSSLKTKKAKTKVTAHISDVYPLSCLSSLSSSSMQKLRFTNRSPIRISFVSTTVLRTRRTST